MLCITRVGFWDESVNQILWTHMKVLWNSSVCKTAVFVLFYLFVCFGEGYLFQWVFYREDESFFFFFFYIAWAQTCHFIKMNVCVCLWKGSNWQWPTALCFCSLTFCQSSFPLLLFCRVFKVPNQICLLCLLCACCETRACYRHIEIEKEWGTDRLV